MTPLPLNTPTIFWCLCSSDVTFVLILALGIWDQQKHQNIWASHASEWMYFPGIAHSLSVLCSSYGPKLMWQCESLSERKRSSKMNSIRGFICEPSSWRTSTVDSPVDCVYNRRLISVCWKTLSRRKEEYLTKSVKFDLELKPWIFSCPAFFPPQTNLFLLKLFL